MMKPLNLILSLILAFSSASVLAQTQEYPRSEKGDLSKAVSIYPNPATDFLNVKLTELSAHKAKLTLYNILGNEIQVETEIVDEHEVKVRVKDLATGYYLIAVHDEQTKFRGTFKFLKR